MPVSTQSLHPARPNYNLYREVAFRLRGGLSFSYLLVNLGELFQIVLQKGDLLLLSSTAASVIGVHLGTLGKQTFS